MSDKETLNQIRNNVNNQMFAGTPKEYRAFEFLLSEIDRQHDTFYNEVRIAHQDKEMSSYRHAQYAGELREKIESQKEEILKRGDAHDKFVNDAFDAVKKLEKEVADQKAITELAVKGLERISVTFERGEMVRLAYDHLHKIKELQNEQI
jgi:hypothetical protein